MLTAREYIILSSTSQLFFVVLDELEDFYTTFSDIWEWDFYAGFSLVNREE